MRMNRYLETRDPFMEWLTLAEEKLKTWRNPHMWSKEKMQEKAGQLKVRRRGEE